VASILNEPSDGTVKGIVDDAVAFGLDAADSPFADRCAG
jgi:hypothetical protein